MSSAFTDRATGVNSRRAGQLMRTYERDGYVILSGVFTAAEVSEMRRESDRLVSLLVDSSLALGTRAPRIDLQRRNGTVVVRKIQPVADISAVFARFASDERLVGALRSILGCEPLLMEEKLNCKQPLGRIDELECADGDEAFDPHTDWAYFRAQGYPEQTLSSALSIDASTPDNGPLRVSPGSHRRDYPERDGYPPVLAAGAIDDGDLVDVLCPPGSVTIFHSKLVHASSENRTNEPRRMMIFSHYPSSHRGDPDRRNRPLREFAQAHERRYQELASSDDYRRRFTLP